MLRTAAQRTRSAQPNAAASAQLWAACAARCPAPASTWRRYASQTPKQHSSEPEKSPNTAAADTRKQAPSPSASQPHITAQEAVDKALEEKGTPPPKPLSRALGVVDPPTKGKQSREEWRADLLNREKRMQERRHLSVRLCCADPGRLN